MSLFRRVLVANRGEIALRVIRACHELDIEAVAVFSDADAGAAHVRAADDAVRLGPAAAAESYLRIDAVIGAGMATGCDAVHPGYGFLSERAAFAEAVVAAGMTWVGPPASAIAALGDKLTARRLAAAAGVPHVPGTIEPAVVSSADDVAAIQADADRIGYPLLVKAAAGGGGRGMRRVRSSDELAAALESGSREAASAFGDGSVYLEREIVPARHVEVQLLGDSTGHVVAIGERDCSTQRRHQKLIEEAPAPGLSEDQRRALHAMAVRLGVAGGLSNAATCEFLYGRDGRFWFLEVNTRLQVEHPVTELVAGIDIVAEQLRLAAGRPLSPAVIDAAERAARPTSHAIEVRISAEDPAREFAPSPGLVTGWRMAAGPGIRVDTAIAVGDRVPADYDPLIAKLIAHAADRDGALARMRRALAETEIGGIQTTLPFHIAALGHPVLAGAVDLATTWVEDTWDGPAGRAAAVRTAVVAAGLDAIAVEPSLTPRGQGGRAPGSEADGGSGWRAAARAAAVTRWPG